MKLMCACIMLCVLLLAQSCVLKPERPAGTYPVYVYQGGWRAAVPSELIPGEIACAMLYEPVLFSVPVSRDLPLLFFKDSSRILRDGHPYGIVAHSGENVALPVSYASSARYLIYYGCFDDDLYRLVSSMPSLEILVVMCGAARNIPDTFYPKFSLLIGLYINLNVLPSNRGSVVVDGAIEPDSSADGCVWPNSAPSVVESYTQGNIRVTDTFPFMSHFDSSHFRMLAQCERLRHIAVVVDSISEGADLLYGMKCLESLDYAVLYDDGVTQENQEADLAPVLRRLRVFTYRNIIE